MSIEAEANQDLATTEAEAETVVGGKKQAKKALHPKAAPHAKTYPVGYIDSPGVTGPAQPYTSDGGDCDDPGYAGSTDTTSTTT